MPKVAVVIPLYNVARYIESALASVAAQTFADFEVIVVDDGSTDAGPGLVQAYPDARIRLVRQANRGLAGARNTGIRESRAEYIALLDADDVWCPQKLARHVQDLEQHPEAGISFSASALIDDDGEPLGLVQRPRPGELDAAHVFCRNPVGNGSAAVLRRAALDELAFVDAERGYTCWFDEDFRQSEDIELWTRMAATTDWRFSFVDSPLTLYRIAAGGLSANTVQQFETWARFRRKLNGFAPDLVARYGDLAEAYQWRYLARRALKSGHGAAATTLACRSIATAPTILREEPVRSLTTLGAAWLCRLLGPNLAGQLMRTLQSRLALAGALRV